MLANCKKYRENNREKIKDYDKRYRAKYKDEIKLKRQIRHKNNPEKYSIMRKKYNSTHKEKVRAICQNWWKEHKGMRAIYRQKYLSQKKQLEATLTKEQWEQIKIDFNYSCAYCGKELPLEQEHFIALSKSGEFTTNNIIPACRSCNASKNNKDFFKWYPQQDCYSKQREKKILSYLNYTENNKQQLTIGI